jgi:hypothetical protein
VKGQPWWVAVGGFGRVFPDPAKRVKQSTAQEVGKKD